MNFYHRRFCNSAKWGAQLQETVIPWVLRDFELGQNVLEIGPGPGLATDVLKDRFEKLTCIEIDDKLAGNLIQRMDGTNVDVRQGDATAMPFPDDTFSAAISMTMLHHVPSPELQDRLLAEAFRVLKPGGLFVGSDSAISLRFRLVHLMDTMVVVNPNDFERRLRRAGFEDIVVRPGKGAFRFKAAKPK